MADFKIAFKITDKIEGGYSNDPDDRGGETWRGVARNLWPKWEGWKYIDSLRHRPDFPQCLAKDAVLEDWRMKFYQKEFWSPIRGSEIKNQAIANALYDSAVNTGLSAAIKMAQVAAFDLPEKDQSFVAKEKGIILGRMDDKTLNKLNEGA